MKKNDLFLEEPIYAKELADKAQGILNKYGAGQFLITGDNRYLSDDLMRLFIYIIKAAGASDAAIERLERECLSGNEIYASNPQYAPNETYTLLRSPHIARNEEALARPLENVGEIREHYFSHLHYILMVDSRALMPERLGGADFDGDMVKTIADPLVNRCVRCGYANGEALPLLKIPTVEPLTANADDWRARYECVRSTFSSRVGQISNAALRLGMIAYNENSGVPERTALRHEIEILTILTGLEIDSAKSGIKPDLSEYLNGNGRGKNLFLQYKAIVMDGEAARKWYEPTKTERLKRYFEGVDWQRVSSNLEKLPFYARELEQKTKKHAPMPVRDEELFDFAKRPEWREQLNPALLERMRSLIGDYEEAQRRLRYLRHAPGEMRRRSDVERILYARGQEELYSVDALYSLFDSIAPERIRRMRTRLTEEKWHLTPPEQREEVLVGMVQGILSTRFAGVLCDFRCGGYRVLGDIICDFDDLHTNALIHRRMTVQKNDSADLRLMLAGITKSGDTREDLIRRCLYALGAHEARERIDYEEAAKCAIALGKRQFALEVLTSSVLNLTREEQGKNNAGGEKKKKRRLFRK